MSIFVKGVRKGALFCQKWYIKGQGVVPWNLVEFPPPPIPSGIRGFIMNRADAYHSLFLSWLLFSSDMKLSLTQQINGWGSPMIISTQFLCKKQVGCHIPYAPCREGSSSCLSFSVVFKIMLLGGMHIPKDI